MSSHPLRFELVASDSGTKARTAKLHLPHGVVHTPVFMPVGTQGTLKGLTSSQIRDRGCEIILGNTYHLGQRPGIDVLRRAGGLHRFMNWDRNLLTDSGGFQMVSLLQLTDLSEAGVQFQSPHDGSTLLLTPEESMRLQNVIGADIMMALDDVVSSLCTDTSRIVDAMERSIRWLDRCIASHTRTLDQNLFGIIQGGLDRHLRIRCCSEMVGRNCPGYAIGGLSGGEDKNRFWKTVSVCTDHLPDDKPRYCMGVGYPEDLIVCVALGADMFDCVYPCRTARFGTALTDSRNLRLKTATFANDFRALDGSSPTIQSHQKRMLGGIQYSRAYFQRLRMNPPVTASVLTAYNIDYMMGLMERTRQSIVEGRFEEFVRTFMKKRYPNSKYPKWVVDALESVGISLIGNDKSE